MMARRLAIHGRVQGVFYRNWTVARAREFGLAGWVRNCLDGSVEAHLEGDPAAVAAMIAAMWDGPPAALVERIEQREVAAEGLSGFGRR